MAPPIHVSLRKVHTRKLYYFFDLNGAVNFSCGLHDVSQDISPTSHDIGLLREVQLRDLVFGHLEWNEMIPACSRYRHNDFYDAPWALHRVSEVHFTMTERS